MGFKPTTFHSLNMNQVGFSTIQQLSLKDFIFRVEESFFISIYVVLFNNKKT